MTIERKSRPGGQKGLKPHGGRHGVPEPKLNARDRAEVPHRPERRAVTAHAAGAINATAAPGTQWCHRCAATRVGESVITRCACTGRDVVIDVAGVDAIGPPRGSQRPS